MLKVRVKGVAVELNCYPIAILCFYCWMLPIMLVRFSLGLLAQYPTKLVMLLFTV
jgi:hypothetical protein